MKIFFSWWLCRVPGPSYSQLHRTQTQATEMALSVKSLLHKREDLSSVPRAPMKKLAAVVCACNPSTEEVETGRSLRLSCWSVLKPIRDPVPEHKGGGS